jgi:hypothetical protein
MNHFETPKVHLTKRKGTGLVAPRTAPPQIKVKPIFDDLFLAA